MDDFTYLKGKKSSKMAIFCFYTEGSPFSLLDVFGNLFALFAANKFAVTGANKFANTVVRANKFANTDY
jgi:hypothetical protein